MIIQKRQATHALASKPVLSYFIANLAVGILVAVGFVLLIVPGIIAMLMFMFSSFIVIDREKGPIESMAVSKLITKGKRWPLLGFVLLLLLINIAGLLALVVGLLVTIPVSTLALHAFIQAKSRGDAGRFALRSWSTLERREPVRVGRLCRLAALRD
jgi:uncharacterized membrane protein